MATLPLGLLQPAVAVAATCRDGDSLPAVKRCTPLSPSDVHVLVVDDEPISRHVVSSLLKCCHYKVTTADNGAEAMDLLRASPPGTFQLVLTDVCMPEVDGIQLLQYVKQEENLRSVPVIMMSSIEQGSTVLDCVTYGAEEYLVKPVTRKEVVNIWQHVVRKQTALTAAVPQQVDSQIPETSCRNNKLPKPIHHFVEGTKRKTDSTPSTVISNRVTEDWKAAGDVLQLIHTAKHLEAGRVAKQLADLEEDIKFISQMVDQPSPEKRKRRRTVPPPTSQKVLSFSQFACIDDTYTARRRHKSGESVPDMLTSLSKDLDVLAKNQKFVVRATLRGENTASPQEMVCCADFDAEDANVATVGVSKIVKVFDIGTVLDPNFSSPAAHSAVHIPIWQASARSKLSSVAWNSYIRSYLVTADYDGSIQLWDTAAVARSSSEVSHFEEHSKRVWSVDFSRLDPPKFLSGSDDGTVRLWSITQESSALAMRTPANVCSVQFSNHSNHLIAAGCANHRVYLFDLRKPDCPAATITGPRKAVSYVRFIGNDLLCAASTDSTIRLWNVHSMLEKQNSRCTAEKSGPGVVNTLTGHVNERNFVGLSTSRDGYVLTGSEDNCVYAYYKTMNFPISKFSNVGEEGSVGLGKKGFISSVSWARASRRALIADSRGGVRLLDFVSNSV